MPDPVFQLDVTDPTNVVVTLTTSAGHVMFLDQTVESEAKARGIVANIASDGRKAKVQTVTGTVEFVEGDSDHHAEEIEALTHPEPDADEGNETPEPAPEVVTKPEPKPAVEPAQEVATMPPPPPAVEAPAPAPEPKQEAKPDETPKADAAPKAPAKKKSTSKGGSSKKPAAKKTEG